MSPLKALLGTPYLRLALVSAMVLVLGQILVCILTVRQGRGKAHLITAAIHLAFGLFVMWVLFDGQFRALFWGQPVEDFPPVLAVAFGRPWLDFALAGLLSLLLLVLSFWGGLPLPHRRLGPPDIKQAVDLLPTALCVCDGGGRVLLHNLRMGELCVDLTGELLTDGNRLWQAVLDRGEPQADRYLIRTERGEALLFAREPMQAQNSDWVQISAADVTEQYRVTQELEAKNRRLREAQARMKSFQDREKDLLVSREIMNARATVHNQMGNVLLTGKYYLDHPDSMGEAELLHMLAYNNDFILREAERPQALREPLEEALRVARSVGVRVELLGPVPAEARARSLLGQAVDQCAANTLRHAGGDRLTVELCREGEKLLARITNNGAPPAGPVAETGGLATLRREIEEAGGTMEVQSSPDFELKLEIPTAQSKV